MCPVSTSHHYEIPSRIVWFDNSPVVEVRRISASALDQAFWDDLWADAPITAILRLDDQPEPPGTGPLHGGIFHTYRCGSTLLCRQLSTLPEVYAIAEPKFLSQLVLQPHQAPLLLRARIMKVLVLLAQGLGARGQKIVVKWPGMLADCADILVQALPDVPMLFLHRDPVEVLASIAQRPLGNTAGAPAALGLTLPPGETSATAEAAMVIAHLCHKVAQVRSIRRCDYERLNPARIASYFGLETDERERAAMTAAGVWYSKAAPGQTPFVNDSATKRGIASTEVHWLANRFLGPTLAAAIAALEEL